MRNNKLIYFYFLSGVLFLIFAGAVYPTEDRNLTPVFTSIGVSIMTISLVLHRRRQGCKK
ncbi:MAG: hypothetical protein HWE26_01530 [Alteromonadaceae bacterium]|nr:hypothetical protein [Alteromonadaceae bacterium]